MPTEPGSGPRYAAVLACVRSKPKRTHMGAARSRREGIWVSVYTQLREAIVTGDLAPGQQLVEAMLAARYSVSRTPIREALTRLEQDGLIVRADRGLIVREITPEEVLDIYETRVVLEARAAEAAADRRTDWDLISMRKAQTAFETTSGDEPDFGKIAIANREFHRTVWVAAHSASLLDLLVRLNALLGRYPETTLSAPGRLAEANAQHSEMIEAITARDSKRAGEVASRHFIQARDVRLRLWAE